jgi:hypothetical protein
VPAADLTPGSYKYAARIQAGERSIQLEIASTITADGPAWTIVDTMTSPMGEAVDTTVLDRKTLTLRRRSVKQGPVTIDVAFDGNRLKGAMNAGGQQQAIDAEVGGPLFAHGAGGPFAIAALPLAEGYRTAFRNFDLQLQKVKLMELEVKGTEKVAVPAGEFDAWRVEIGSADGGPEKATLWVAKDSRKPVKIVTVMPQMGGAVLTMELQ